MQTHDLEAAVRDFLEQRRIAVSGVSRSPDQAANTIYRKLRSSGYRVFAVNPSAESVEGDTCYPRLGAIPGGVDAVVIATPPGAAPELARECIELGIRRVWMHRSFGRGSVSDEAVTLCRSNGIRVIPGGCPMMFCAPVDVAHRCMRWWLRLTGSLPKAALATLLTLGLPLGACRPAAPEVPAHELARAQAALQPFKEQLLGALTSALETGAENAISVCRQRAPEIAAQLSVGGLEMGRTSHRLRNPTNAPRTWVEPLLSAVLEDPDRQEPIAVYLDDATIGYVEAIRVVPFCVSCHGPAVEPGLLERIRELYPDDQAIGFRVGDVRGVFWLTMPVRSAGS